MIKIGENRQGEPHKNSTLKLIKEAIDVGKIKPKDIENERFLI